MPEPRDPALTPGNWIYDQDTRGSIARYGPAGGDAAFVLRCDRSGRRIFVSVPGTTGGAMLLRASTALRSVPALPTGGLAPYVAVELAARDSILDALAFSRGRFTIELGPTRTVLPTWPEFARVVEDCRG